MQGEKTMKSEITNHKRFGLILLDVQMVGVRAWWKL